MEQGRVHNIELLAMAVTAATTLGYRIREEVLAGFPGGACEVYGQKWLFLDPSLSARERLPFVLDAIKSEPAMATLELPAPLARVLHGRQAA